MFQHGYAVRQGLADASKTPTVVLKLLKRPAMLYVERLQTVFDVVMSTFFGGGNEGGGVSEVGESGTELGRGERAQR